MMPSAPHFLYYFGTLALVVHHSVLNHSDEITFIGDRGHRQGRIIPLRIAIVAVLVPVGRRSTNPQLEQ